MINEGVLKNSAFHSILGESSVLAPKSERTKRSVVAELLLTSLVDAFSILVVYLLLSFSNSGELLYLNKGTELPKAAQAEALERHPVVKVDDGKIYLENEEVTADQLVPALLESRKQWIEQHPGEEFPGIITVQGDRRLKYELLNSIVLASAQTGFSDIKFAVIMK